MLRRSMVCSTSLLARKLNLQPAQLTLLPRRLNLSSSQVSLTNANKVASDARTAFEEHDFDTGRLILAPIKKINSQEHATLINIFERCSFLNITLSQEQFDRLISHTKTLSEISMNFLKESCATSTPNENIKILENIMEKYHPEQQKQDAVPASTSDSIRNHIF